MLRPMDFSSDEDELGPLGIAESKAVSWLEEVMDTEAARAQSILDNDGVPVRPAKNEESPLGQIEKATVNFVDSVVKSEKARGELAREEESVFGVFMPPSSLPEGVQGPLGKAEASVKNLIKDISEAETVRAQLTNSGSEKRVVRPLDVGGPFGEAERFMSDIQMAEKKRAMEKSTDGKKFVRPMDATVKGPLGETEERLVGLVDSLKVEETRRYQNLVENRPMNTNRKSVEGVLESVSVGVLRAPVMLVKIASRVKELLSGEGGEGEEEENYEVGVGGEGEEVVVEEIESP
ncbi:hypothetical protein TL16_g02322 [Triparma laevis f. inornata]|uniref:Uncharacterized protein n=1 Tax=Triparma laevis f. inornata TaxID=1714386 RepID=A0A9W7DW83_9STRA|nr:hypothetical protein TL16_g02322 [Triparma laevis f. inornata]